MTGYDVVKGGLDSLFAEQAQAPIPAGELDRVLAAVASRRPRSARLARYGSASISDSSWAAAIDALRVPAPAVRPRAAALLLLVLLALIGTATLVGARLLEPPRAPDRLLYELDGDIYLADADGGNPIMVAEGADLLDGSPWAPDGRHFLFFDRARTMAVISEADGHALGSFPNAPGMNGFPVWSPDSAHLQAWTQGSGLIGIYGTDGGLQAGLPLPDGYARSGENLGTWAPDGRSVWVLISQGDGESQAWALPIDGSAPRRLAEGLGSAVWGRSFTRDGTRMAFSTGRFDEALIYVANADGTDRRLVGEGVYPTWSPSAGQLAYVDPVSGKADKVDLVVVDVATGSTRTLVPDFKYGGPDFSWSPGGDQILFAKEDARGTMSAWTVDADGGQPTMLVEGAANAEWQPAPATAIPTPAS